MLKVSALIMVAASLSCGVSSVALAQAAQVGGAEAADGATSTPDQSLGDIVVTAQRRAERLQDVPLSVQAASGEQLARKGVGNIQDLGNVVPSLGVASAVGFAITNLRAVGSTALGPGIEVPVSIYVDGVYYASAASSLFDFNNIDHVEVLKGPQGTLFGRNATGGLIQVFTKDPTQDFHMKIGAGIDNYASAKGEAYISGGLTEDVAADLSVMVGAQGRGWGKNLATGKDVNQNLHNVALRSKWVFQLGDRTKATLIGDYTDQKNSFNELRRFPGTALPAFLHTTADPGDPWDRNTDIDPSVTNRNWGASLKLVHEFDGVTLSNMVAYRWARTHLVFDIDTTPVPHFSADLHELEKQFSNEVQLSSNGSGPLVWTAGAFYFRARGIYDPGDVYSTNGLDGQLFPAPIDKLSRSGNQLTESISGYAQGTYEFVPDTRLTLGVRYTHERREVSGHWELGFLDDPTIIPFATFTKRSLSFNKPTFRVAVDHRFSPEVLAYASFNTGFKSGGFNTAVPDEKFLPETIKAYEAGIKADLLNRRLRLNMAGYYYDYKNIQVQRVSEGVTGIVNGASARIYGAELELDALVTDAFRLSGSAAYTNAKFRDYPDAVFTAPGGGVPAFSADASGNDLGKAPRFQGNLSGTYTWNMTGGSTTEFNLTGIYSSRYFFESHNLVQQSAFAKLNASLKWIAANERYSVRLFGNNLTNKAVGVYSSTLADGTIGITYDAPRTYGVKLEYSF